MKKGVTNLTSRRRISVADAALPKCLVLLLDLHNLLSLEKYSLNFWDRSKLWEINLPSGNLTFWHFLWHRRLPQHVKLSPFDFSFTHLLYQELLQVGHLLADLLLELLLNILVASTTSSFTRPHCYGSLIRFLRIYSSSAFSFYTPDLTSTSKLSCLLCPCISISQHTLEFSSYKLVALLWIYVFFWIWVSLFLGLSVQGPASSAA